jgi:uncharacterized protein
MPIRFFQALRAGGLKPSVTEYLSFCAALKAQLVEPELEQFYQLARLSLVKDEAQFDRFDQVFGAFFNGIEQSFTDPNSVPDQWLQSEFIRNLSDEDKAKIQSLGSFEALLDTLRERLREQQGKHQGGNKWIGTGGTSPFGHSGYNPEGFRIGGKGQHQRAVKVWEQRQYRDFDDSRELDSRQMKLALRKLRQFARTGNDLELNLDATIQNTARNAGWLDLQLEPTRKNAVKLLLLLDVGGSMDAHIYAVEQLFHAARSEFKHLEHYYFHNFIYESVWKENARRKHSSVSLFSLLQKFGRDYKVVFVGDASMSPYEVMAPGGSLEHWNDEAGSIWVKRLLEHFPQAVWLNPTPERQWHYSQSTQIIKELMSERMFTLSLDGLEKAMRCLRQRLH